MFRNDDIWKEFNIVGDLGAMPNISPMNEADFAALCAIYNTLDGNGWRTKWLTNKNAQTASRWRGVTFDEEGYVTSIDLSGNRLSGDLGGLTFTGLTRLTSLNLSSNTLMGDVISLKAQLPAGCILNVERQELGDLGEHTLYEICQLTEGLPSIALYSTRSGQVSTLIGVGGECQFYGTSADGLGNWEGGIRVDGSTWSNGIFRWPSATTIECTYPHHFTFTYNYEMGDANMDDALNVLDLQSTLNYSNGQQWGLFNFYAADTYGQDDDINVQDIVATVNILLEQEYDVKQMSFVRSKEVQRQMSEACVSVENGQVVLYTTKPVAALDLRITGVAPEDMQWDVEALGFAAATTAQADGTHAIIYSLLPREIEEGRTVLATFDAAFSPRLSSAVLSDSQARQVNVGKDMPTGIRLHNGDLVNRWSIISLSGQRLATGTHATEADIINLAKSRGLHGVFILSTDGVNRNITIK